MLNRNLYLKPIDVLARTPWWLLGLLTLVFGVSLLAAPGVLQASDGNGTIPPPLNLPTILVGPVDSISAEADSLVVAGVTVTTDDETKTDERVGALVVGGWVRVEGFGDGSGSLAADRLKTLPALPLIKLAGPLDSLSDTQLVVDGISFKRTSTTLVVGDPVAGEDRVGIRAAVESTGALLALQVVKINPIPDDPDDDDDDDDGTSNNLGLIGAVDSLPDGTLVGDWMVSGIPVKVSAETKISRRVSRLAPGAWVKIHGHIENAVFIAESIRTTHSQDFHKVFGTLDSLSALEVVVGGLTLDLSADASVQGDPQPGDKVTVKALLSDTGALVAVLVEKSERGQPPGRPGLVIKFVGTINALPGEGLYGDWTIAGRTVNVPEGALIDEHKAAAAVNAVVKVIARVGNNNTITAYAIIVVRDADGHDDDDDDQHGHHGGDWKVVRAAVESLPADDDLIGDWVVGGVTVHVSERTDLGHHQQTIAVGDTVLILGWLQDDGSVRAKSIRLSEAQNSEVTIIGLISELPAQGLIGTWLVDERTVVVTEQTDLDDEHGSFAAGKRVKVRGTQQVDGSITAIKIEAIPEPEVQYVGAIVSFPDSLTGEWTVGEKIVNADANTEFKQENGNFAIGVLVRVKGNQADNGSITARKIEVLRLPKIEYTGEIITLPDTADLTGVWQIGALGIVVTAETDLDDDPNDFAVGVRVRIEARVQPDGTFRAEEIEKAHGHHNAMPR